MKLINSNSKHTKYVFFDDTEILNDEEIPHRVPSYIDTAKKHKPKSKSAGH